MHEPARQSASDAVVVEQRSWVAAITDVVGGDELAWRRFVARVHPLVLALCRRRGFAGGPGEPADTHRDVAVRALDRMRARDFAALRGYLGTRDKYPHAAFSAWLAAIVANTYIDYLRSLPEYQRKRRAEGRTLERLEVVELSGREASVERLAERAEVKRILDCLMNEEFPADQRKVIVLWLHGNTIGEIATAIGTDEDEARRRLRAARQRLRRAVRGPNNRRNKEEGAR